MIGCWTVGFDTLASTLYGHLPLEFPYKTCFGASLSLKQEVVATCTNILWEIMMLSGAIKMEKASICMRIGQSFDLHGLNAERLGVRTLVQT